MDGIHPAASRDGMSNALVWRGRLSVYGHSVELALHLLFPPTLVGVTVLVAEALLPRLFPGWPAGLYWAVAAGVALIDSLAGLLHELGHAAAAIARGRRVYRITLYGLVAAARRAPGPPRPRDQLAIALAGPVCHLLVASCLMLIWTLVPRENEALRVVTGFPALSNFAVGLVNLLPVSPLDGGRAARALLSVLG